MPMLAAKGTATSSQARSDGWVILNAIMSSPPQPTGCVDAGRVLGPDDGDDDGQGNGRGLLVVGHKQSCCNYVGRLKRVL
jgi:hypothetical protein